MANTFVLFCLCFVLFACSEERTEKGFIVGESLNTGLVCLATKAELSSRAIYGADNRLDWFESPGQTKDYWARATLALIPGHKLQKVSDQFKVVASSYQNVVGLCDGQPFADQPSAAFCSGFLVSEDLVVTAGHCVRDLEDCQATQFVFDYAKVAADQEDYFIPTESVYNCKEIVVKRSVGDDFAVIQLDRAVVGRTPLNVRRQGQLNIGDQLMLVGHPMGLPSKIADGGFVQSVGNKIVATVDAFAANSGSVLLNSRTGLVEGLLIAGEADLSFVNGCRVEKKCGNDCAGEVITPIAKVLDYIPNVSYENPICNQAEDGLN